MKLAVKLVWPWWHICPFHTGQMTRVTFYHFSMLGVLYFFSFQDLCRTHFKRLNYTKHDVDNIGNIWARINLYCCIFFFFNMYELGSQHSRQNCLPLQLNLVQQVIPLTCFAWNDRVFWKKVEGTLVDFLQGNVLPTSRMLKNNANNHECPRKGMEFGMSTVASS